MYDIIIENLNYFYDSICALQNVNLKIKTNEFSGITGPNGGGKTTLLKVILKLLEPGKGSSVVKENKRIGYVPQFASFDRSFPVSVSEVILSGILPEKPGLFHKYSSSDIKKMEDLTGTLGLSGLKENRINELSGGQLQKVLIGRALISEPEILVLDEPTSNLDINTRKDIYRILSDLKGKKTVIIVIHEIEELLSYLDSIIYVNKTVDYFKNDKSLIDSDTRKICRHSIMHALEQRIYNKCLSETGGSKDAGCSS